MITKSLREYGSTRYLLRSKNGSSPWVSSYPGTTFVYTGSLTKDEGVPRWRQLIRAGSNASSNLFLDSYQVLQSPAIFSFGVDRVLAPVGPNDHFAREVDGYFPGVAINGLTPPVASHSTAADNQALTKLYQHLSAVETSFKGMVFTGELRESLAMIRHPARALRRGLDGYLSTVRNRGRRRPNESLSRARARRESTVRDTWLEYSFGWVPLINDLDSAMKAFYLSDCVRPNFEMVRGRGKIEAPQPTSTAIWNSGEGTSLLYEVRKGNVSEAKYYGIYRSTGSGSDDLHTYGFRPSEFVPTIWELIPYSFLVDYFSNIGKILESWSYRQIGMDWCTRTRFSYGYHLAKGVSLVDKPTEFSSPTYSRWRVHGSLGHTELRRVLLNRERSINPGVPSLELKVPGNWTKWANLAALSKNLGRTRSALSS